MQQNSGGVEICRFPDWFGFPCQERRRKHLELLGGPRSRKAAIAWDWSLDHLGSLWISVRLGDFHWFIVNIHFMHSCDRSEPIDRSAVRWLWQLCPGDTIGLGPKRPWCLARKLLVRGPDEAFHHSSSSLLKSSLIDLMRLICFLLFNLCFSHLTYLSLLNISSGSASAAGPGGNPCECILILDFGQSYRYQVPMPKDICLLFRYMVYTDLHCKR